MEKTVAGTRAFRMSLDLDATPEQVWQALTDPQELVRWFPTGARVRPGEGGTMLWSWGYYSIFDADAILYDNFKCGEVWSTYCNKELDALIEAGRSTLDQKKRAEIYVKAQKLLYDDAAAIFKWGLRGVWGVSNRIEYDALNRVYRQYVPEGPPARTVWSVRIMDAFKVQLDAIAVI